MESLSQRKLAVIGQGYVGLPLALAACEAGYSVVGVDNNQNKIKVLTFISLIFYINITINI